MIWSCETALSLEEIYAWRNASVPFNFSYDPDEVWSFISGKLTKRQLIACYTRLKLLCVWKKRYIWSLISIREIREEKYTFFIFIQSKYALKWKTKYLPAYVNCPACLWLRGSKRVFLTLWWQVSLFLHLQWIIFTRYWCCYVNKVLVASNQLTSLRFLATNRTQLSSTFNFNMAAASPKRVKSPKTPKTPSKKTSISNSPSPRSCPSRNLSDVARKVRDCCASWHENAKNWSKLKEAGLSLANKLVNLQLQKEYVTSSFLQLM